MLSTFIKPNTSLSSQRSRIRRSTGKNSRWRYSIKKNTRIRSYSSFVTMNKELKNVASNAALKNEGILWIASKSSGIKSILPL